jgi:putative phosphoesterase
MTKLGIISDSHGRTARTRQALHLLLARGAERIIHLGDVESEAILDLLVGHDATVVFGNCDDERSLSRYAQALGIRVVHPGAIIEIKPSAVDLSARDASAGLARSIRIGVTHGHLEHEVSRLLADKVDVLLHGHTHEIRDEQLGCTRVMNPGALHRAARYTVMLFDPSTGQAEWLDVE